MSLNYSRLLLVSAVTLSMSLLVACGDVESSFDTNKRKAYIANIMLSGGVSQDISFEKMKTEYEVVTTERPASVDVTVIPDDNDVTVTYANNNGSVSGAVSASPLTVPLSTDSDTVLTFKAAKAGAVDSTYSIRFRLFEQDTSLSAFRPVSTSSLWTNKYKNFTTAYSPVRNSYSVRFYPDAMGIYAATLNPASKLYIEDAIKPSSGSLTTFSFPSNMTRTIAVRVESADATKTNFIKVSLKREMFVYDGPWQKYTTTPYDFSGNILSVRNGIVAVTTSPWTYTPSEELKTVRGVVTGTHYYTKFVSGAGQPNVAYYKTFFVEDKDTGLQVSYPTPTAEPSEFPAEVGDIVEFKISHGIHNYQMPIAIIDAANTTIKVVGRVDALYYQTGAYDNAAARGRVFMWQGIPASFLGDPYTTEGYFVRSNLLYEADSRKDWALLFVDALEHRFYGPVSYGYSKHKIWIQSPSQIHYNNN